MKKTMTDIQVIRKLEKLIEFFKQFQLLFK